MVVFLLVSLQPPPKTRAPEKRQARAPGLLCRAGPGLCPLRPGSAVPSQDLRLLAELPKCLSPQVQVVAVIFQAAGRCWQGSGSFLATAASARISPQVVAACCSGIFSSREVLAVAALLTLSEASICLFLGTPFSWVALRGKHQENHFLDPQRKDTRMMNDDYKTRHAYSPVTG